MISRENVRTIRRLFAYNGVRWTACCLTYYFFHYAFKWDIHLLEVAMSRLEEKYNLPGISSTDINYRVWQYWDWEDGGEEWNVSPEWKESVINSIMRKHIEPGRDILELGPGAGRWTEPLQQMASHLTIVDLSDECIDLCKKRFAACDNMAYFVNEGSNLDFLADESIDFIWAFDVFTHVNQEDTQRYAQEFKRILRSGGRGVVTHAGKGRVHDAWPSKVPADMFTEIIEQAGLTVKTQFSSWEDGQTFEYSPRFHDCVTVFEK